MVRQEPRRHTVVPRRLAALARRQAVDGASPNLSGRAFLVWLHLRKERGDEVVLTVRAANGDAESIRFRLPE